jgi:hypothetical protein
MTEKSGFTAFRRALGLGAGHSHEPSAEAVVYARTFSVAWSLVRVRGLASG